MTTIYKHDLGTEAYSPETPGIFAFWIDRRGTVVRNTRGVTLTGQPDQQGISLALSGREQYTERTLDGVPVRLLTVPVVAEGRVAGAVQVGTSLLASRQSIAQTIVIFLLTGIVGIVLAGLGSVFLAHRAMRPIRPSAGRVGGASDDVYLWQLAPQLYTANIPAQEAKAVCTRFDARGRAGGGG